MSYESGEPGDVLSLQCEWDTKRVNEEMKRLSGEPYQVYVNGLGWRDASEAGRAPSEGRHVDAVENNPPAPVAGVVPWYRSLYRRVCGGCGGED